MPEMQIFTRPGGEETLSEAVAKSKAALGVGTAFDYPAILRGTTTHFQVYYDPALGTNGTQAADAVLATCEQDYATLQSWFGGITPPGLPIQVVIAPLDPSGNGGGGAYHYGCSAVTLYCDAKWVPVLDVEYTRLLVIAEEVEVFEAAQGRGWNCAASNGEGLSRVLAEQLHPGGIIPWMYSAPTWLNSPTRPDYISVTDPTDRNYVSTGCAVLFLYYLRYQLDFTWGEIVQAAGTTLQQTYQNLTGETGAYATFTRFLQSFYPIGRPSGLTTDNPFPLGLPTRFPICGVQFTGTVGAHSTHTWFTWGWPALWRVEWLVVPTNIGPQIECNVQVQKSGAGLTYFIVITNLSPNPVDIEGRYIILCA